MNFHKPITKSIAISVFGSKTAMAEAIEIKTQSLARWPEVLSKKCRDRVEAAIHRKGLEKEMQAALRVSSRKP